MTDIPPTIRPAWERTIKRAQRSISIGSIPVDVVEELIAMVVTQHEAASEQDRRKRELERRIVMLGGGFDRRGLEGDGPGYIVQHGIHPVIEDAP
jgi:hypothetical protein